jgi:hypothetical protein
VGSITDQPLIIRFRFTYSDPPSEEWEHKLQGEVRAKNLESALHEVGEKIGPTLMDATHLGHDDSKWAIEVKIAYGPFLPVQECPTCGGTDDSCTTCMGYGFVHGTTPQAAFLSVLVED